MNLIDQLTEVLGQGAVLTAGAQIQGFVEDWRGRYRGPAACVVLPSSTPLVAAVFRLFVAHGVTILPKYCNTRL